MKTAYDINWGSHLPVLIKVMELTEGPVLELGMGLYSTPFLHFACYKKRYLVSYETDKHCYEMNKDCDMSNHEVKYVKDWDHAMIDRGWDVVLVDHAPSQRRVIEITKLANIAKFIVIHDTQRNSRFCDLDKIWPLFKYRFDYKKAIPWTTVVSNFVDVKSLLDNI